MNPSAERMQQLIRDLLAYSRIGTRGSRLQAVPAEQCLSEALTNLRSSLEETDARVEASRLPVVYADPAQLPAYQRGISRDRHRARDLQAHRRACGRAHLGGLGTRPGFDVLLRVAGCARLSAHSGTATAQVEPVGWRATAGVIARPVLGITGLARGG